MTRRRQFLAPAALALGCFIYVSGCRPSAPAMHYGGTGSKRVGPTSVLYVEFNDRLGLVVWCDFLSTGGGSIGGGVRGLPNGVEYSGKVQAADDRRVEWKWVTPDNASGTIVLNGKDYDFARGRLFLVSTNGGNFEVRQLQRDLSGVRPDGLQSFADSDPDVTKFVAEAANAAPQKSSN